MNKNLKSLLPHTADGLTPELLTGIIGNTHPGANVTGVKLIEAHEYGDGQVSTSARATLELEYGAGTARNLPRRVVVKLSFDSRNQANDVWFCQLHGLFENEVNFYNRIRPELDIEAPLSLSGLFDAETRRYVLILEDLGLRDVHFPTMLEAVSIENVQGVLDTQARLHARFWQSPRFNGDLSWVGTHQQGSIETLMRGIIPAGIKNQVETHQFKRELLGRLGTTVDELFPRMCAVRQHQSTLPQTLLHGDCHICNTYRMPDGSGGLNDWQLFVRGYAMHDVTYLILTSLPIEQRRKHERELLAFYRDRLQRYGVADPPDPETLWREYRHAALWSFYIGWLGTPPENYGWATLSMALLRLSTAFEDLETLKLVSALL